MKDIKSIRREYGKYELLESSLSPNPFHQFEVWLNEALEQGVLDATAMVLATTDEKGFPDARVVLLKEFDQHGFVFFTHYNSPKAIQAEKTGVVALNFHWPLFSRQIRIKGQIARISTAESETYFLSRPKESQLSTLASKQSTVIPSRKALEQHIKEVAAAYATKEIHCPANWGGYRVTPFEFEFFQGRDFRLNDRIRYLKVNDQWKIERLSP